MDMTTSQPSLAVEIYEAAKKKNVFSLDAPGKLLSLHCVTLSVWRRRRRSRCEARDYGGRRPRDLRSCHASLPSMLISLGLIAVYGNEHSIHGESGLRPAYQDV